MDKNKKKKASPKTAKTPSAYKSRETEGKASQTEAAFQKSFGTAKDRARKG